MRQGKRHVRVGESIREILAEQLTRGLKTPGVGFCTITGVDVTEDLRQARVYVSVYGSEAEQQQTMQALGRASSFLKGEVARALRTKVIPQLEFRQDTSIERGARLDAAIKQAREADAELARARGEAPETSSPPPSSQEASHGEDAPNQPGDQDPGPTGTGGSRRQGPSS